MMPWLLAALLAQPEAHIGPQSARALIQASQVMESRFRLPAGLLVAVVLAETGGRDVVARGRGKGRRGCDVGVAQIHVPGCHRSAVAAVRPLLQNLKKAAKILNWSRTRCRKSPSWPGCRQCIWGRYNPGSSTWCLKVLEIWGRLKNGTRTHHSS